MKIFLRIKASWNSKFIFYISLYTLMNEESRLTFWKSIEKYWVHIMHMNREGFFFSVCVLDYWLCAVWYVHVLTDCDTERQNQRNTHIHHFWLFCICIVEFLLILDFHIYNQVWIENLKVGVMDGLSLPEMQMVVLWLCNQKITTARSN